MYKLEIKQGSLIQQTQYFIPVEIDLSVVPARLGIWFFSLVPSDNRNTRSTCLTSVFTGIGQTLMSRPGSSIKFLHFVPFHHQIWPPRAILVFDWLLFKKIFSETAWQNGAKLGRKHIWKSKPGIDGPWVCPFQNCVRQPHPPFKMAAIF
jgi:hypothetical protein